MDMLAKVVKRYITTDEKNKYSKKPNGKKYGLFMNRAVNLRALSLIFKASVSIYVLCEVFSARQG